MGLAFARRCSDCNALQQADIPAGEAEFSDFLNRKVICLPVGGTSFSEMETTSTALQWCCMLHRLKSSVRRDQFPIMEVGLRPRTRAVAFLFLVHACFEEYFMSRCT